jgi:hypothetical protein
MPKVCPAPPAPEPVENIPLQADHRSARGPKSDRLASGIAIGFTAER